MINEYLILSIGFLAQFLFSARIIVQWIMSERAKKVLSPSIFWYLSLAASFLLFIYGWFREDFAIMLGQLIAYYIYIWNLYEKKDWRKIPLALRTAVKITPILGIAYILYNREVLYQVWFQNEDIPLSLVIYGSIGQILFTLRFVYQFFYSRRHKESLLPGGFWIISIIGSAAIVSYGIFRKDIVIILGQSFGFLSYTRNLLLIHRNNKHSQSINEN